MAHQLVQNIPNGGLDTDKDNRYVAQDDYRYALNIRNGVAYAGKQNVVTNVKGNSLTPFLLPSGVNKVVGAYEDKQENTVIYFVYNSNGNQLILRYNPDANTITEVMRYNFGWTADTKITSVSLINAKLLYWSDPKPRKINIEKATLAGKIKTWEVVLAKSQLSNDFFQVVVTNMAGQNITSINVNITGATVADKLQALANTINNQLSQYFEAEYCDCKITLTEKQVNSYNISFTNLGYLAIPLNWYGTIIDRHIDRAKWQPPFEPIATYIKDTSINYNRVKGKVFQFRLQYWYDDFEGSDLALGAISEIPINNAICNEVAQDAFNCIELTIPDDSLWDIKDLSILKEVRILVREGNEGAWRIVENITPCEWFDRENNQSKATYRFYNNIATTAIDDATVAKPYDDVPLEVGAEIVVKNRGILADVKKGYDAPDCVEIDVEQTFEETAQPQGYTVTAKIRIYNPSLTTSIILPRNVYGGQSKTRSGIFKKDDVSEFPIYGGVVNDGSVRITSNPSGENKPPIESAFEKEQILPESGFVCYLAGTDYFAISKQIKVSSLTQDVSLNIQLNSPDSQTKANNFFGGNDDLYSVVEIKNVPAGKYVMRVASPFCSFGDKLGKGSLYDLTTSGRGYQRTSAPIWGIIDSTNAYYPITEIPFEVTNSDVFVGDFIVKDHAIILPKNSGGYFYPICITGYVYDANGSSAVQDVASGATVEKSEVMQLITGQNSFYKDYFGVDWTDHNGYFSVYAGNNFNSYSVQVRQISNNVSPSVIKDFQGNQFWALAGQAGALTQLGNLTIQTDEPYNPNNPLTLLWAECIIPTDETFARQACSTFVEGRILDQDNNPVSGMLVVYQSGRYDYTDLDGRFKILAWGDMRGLVLNGNQNNRIVDDIILNSFGVCGTAIITQSTYNVDITPFIPNYTPLLTFDLGDLFVQYIDNGGVKKARKRGGSYLLGVRFYDDTGRLCSVVQGAEVYIPFITEDLGQILPDQYALGTYRYGKPTITATINTPPPSWAKYMRFMWTRNLYQGKYLQWCANEVKYITSYDNDNNTFTETTFQNGDATMIMINISNIATFARQNNESQIGYSYEAGDRIRLIADRDLNYFNGLFDTEVISYVTGGWLLVSSRVSLPELKSGTLFEVYNNKPVTEDKIFYECGQPIRIINGQYETNTVTFTSGDTYWRGRFIPVNDDTTNFATIYPLTIEDRSISDFYPSEDEDIGRVGVIDLTFKQLRYPTMMQHSNIYVEGSAVNGLSSFEALNFKLLNVNFGAIKRLFYVGNTLISVHENKVVANYIELRSLSDANTTDGLLAISDAYFGNDRPLTSEYGTQNPESAVEYNGNIYFIDKQRGVICRYDNNGLDAISDKNIRSFVLQKCADGFDVAWGVFDPYYREYILSIGDTTIAWNEEKNKFTTFYSFVGECYATVLRGIVSFKNGQLWAHDTNPIYNNFYGVQYNSALTPIPHLDNEKVIWFNISLQGLQNTVNQNNWSIINITNSDGQQSRLTKQQFRKMESFWYAAFLRDTTDTTVNTPIINGRKLRSQDLVLSMQNDATEQWYLQQIITTYTPSARSVI